MNEVPAILARLGLTAACLLLAGAILLRWFQRSPDTPWRLTGKILLTLAVLGALWLALQFRDLRLLIVPGLAVVAGVILAPVWAANLGGWLARPLTSAIDGGDEPPEARPHYAIARALCRQRRFAEAVAEIQTQLRRFPEDYEGQILLAEIQARQLGDLPAAEATIQLLCAQPRHADRDRIAALTALAGWHERIGRNPPAAAQVRRQIAEISLQAARSRPSAP